MFVYYVTLSYNKTALCLFTMLLCLKQSVTLSVYAVIFRAMPRD